MTAAVGTGSSSVRTMHEHGRRPPTPGRATRCRRRRAPRAGWRRRRSTPTCTAPMNRIQFSLPAKRPASRGCAGRDEDRDERADVSAAITSATHEWSASSSDGPSAKPKTTSSGERDEAGEAFDARPTRTRSRSNRSSLRARLTRTTSPPIVDGSTLPTNWPASV